MCSIACEYGKCEAYDAALEPGYSSPCQHETPEPTVSVVNRPIGPSTETEYGFRAGFHPTIVGVGDGRVGLQGGESTMRRARVSSGVGLLAALGVMAAAAVDRKSVV